MTNTTIPHTLTGIVCGRCSTKGKNAIIKRHANPKAVAACFAIGYAPAVEVPAPAPAPQPKAFNRFAASCHVKGCKQHEVRGTSFVFQCPSHKWVRKHAKQLVGTLSTSSKHKCNTACTGAVGPVCVCQCGGANHGLDHLIKL